MSKLRIRSAVRILSVEEIRLQAARDLQASKVSQSNLGERRVEVVRPLETFSTNLKRCLEGSKARDVRKRRQRDRI